jgi:hypothetical protein
MLEHITITSKCPPVSRRESKKLMADEEVGKWEKRARNKIEISQPRKHRKYITMMILMIC